MPGPSGHSRRRARGSRHGSRVGSFTGDRERDRERSDGAGAAPQSQSAQAQSQQQGQQPQATQQSTAQLVQEAQDAAAELKGLFASQPPWAGEVDAVRQRARNALLAVLFGHPLSPHAQSIDTLWFNTTYSMIQEYREVVARIEAALPAAGSGSGSRRGGSKSGGGGGGAANDPVTDLRRTLARFRSLLGSEDTFYRGLITRIVGFYRLQEQTRGHLALVGIPVPVEGAEDDPSLAPPLSREEAEKKVSIVYKGLVYLGDLERYKEQYSDKARREAREGKPAAQAQGGRDSERYARAILFYEVARGLQPDIGQAFNQLAVIDGYVGDNFHCTYHYFRALAVRSPFPSGRANLERVFKKAFDRWRRNDRPSSSSKQDKDEGAGGSGGGDDAERFKRDLLTILSIHFVRAGTTHLPKLRPALLDLFSRLLRARQLPSEVIVKTTAMVIGSHWHARTDQSTGQADPEDASEAAKLSERRRIVEDVSLAFMLQVFTVLVAVSADEAEEVLRTQVADESALATDDDPEDDTERDGTLALAARITAVVRRILPSLRIASRWLKSHLEYLARAASGTRNTELSGAITQFWTEYKRLALAFARVFPLAQLPSLVEPLEEDLDMRGFLPLRRGLTAPDGTEELNVDSTNRQEVHPNEEQLMRISDLLVDVKLLMQTEYGSIALNTGTPLPSAPFVAGPSDEAASISVSTETEDDPVNLAMRATLTEGSSVGEEAEFDDDEEVILWGRSTPVVQDASQLPHQHHPSHTQHQPQAHAQTAQDLMQSLTLAPAPANQPHLLFGGDAGAGSIWTMSREESQKGAHRGSIGSKPVPPHLATLWNDSSVSPHHATPTSSSNMWTPSQPQPLGHHMPPLPHQPHVPHQHTPHQSLSMPQHQPPHHQHHMQPHYPMPPPGIGVPPGVSPSWSSSPGQSPFGSARHSPSSIWGAPGAGGNTWGPPVPPGPSGAGPSPTANAPGHTFHAPGHSAPQRPPGLFQQAWPQTYPAQ